MSWVRIPLGTQKSNFVRGCFFLCTVVNRTLGSSSIYVMPDLLGHLLMVVWEIPGRAGDDGFFRYYMIYGFYVGPGLEMGVFP